MINIPLKAKVQCSDGACGQATNAIINPDTHRLTHLAVQDKSPPDNPTRMVPFENVASTAQDQISLSCTRDEVGKLDELVLDPKSGDITHYQMQEGHLWGKKDVAIPVSDVEFIDEDTVYLKIDKKAVKALPAVAVKRKAG